MEIAQLELACQCHLGEGPLYRKSNQCLYWIDIVKCQLHQFNLIEKVNQVIELEDIPGTIGLTDNDELVILMAKGLYHLNTMGDRKWISRPEDMGKELRFNDGKPDPWGRFVVGTMLVDGAGKEVSPMGSLYMIDERGKFSNLFESQYYIPNGLAWLGRDVMYHIDSIKGKVFEHTYNGDQLGEGKLLIDFKDEMGVPDGMTIDKEGMLWIAHWGGNQISRWDPKTGTKLESVHVPCKNVTCVTFGGDNFDVLYITTAIEEGKNQREYQLEGAVYSYRPKVGGYPPQTYRLQING